MEREEIKRDTWCEMEYRTTKERERVTA